jgi:PPOX class probable F420-dependent enzyme
MELDKARSFIKKHPRAVLVTSRSDGSPQMAPVLAAVDDDGALLISSRETAYKTKNLRRDPRIWMCFLSEAFFGEWIQVGGTADIVSLPEAMDVLIDYYRRLQGDHPDWDDYRNAMEREKRLVIRVTIDQAGPDRSG